MSLEELQKRRAAVRAGAEIHLNNIKVIRKESERVADVAANSEIILEDIDREFSKCTGLTDHDISVLFMAVALQMIRQYVFTKFPERLDDQKAAQNTKGHLKEHSNRVHRYYNPSLEEILTNPVPFDANIGANGALAGGKQMGHRVTALGHDPILGLFFGTSNIATSTLTNNRLLSYHIYTNAANKDYFRGRADTRLIFNIVKDKLLNEGMEGKKIIGVSLLNEIIHLKSDLNTANSLPLPVLSVVNPNFAADLAKRGFDMSNAMAMGKQAGYAVLVNTLVYMIHSLLYDRTTDENYRLYEVRTRKILSYSNIIASASNLLFIGMNSLNGIEGAYKALDIGGLVVTTYRIVTDVEFIRRVKQKFIENEFFSRIRGSEYDFIDL